VPDYGRTVLGRADAGWYQVRRALEASGETELTEKLRPMVYDLGFLPA
jgi:hypothetical protein